MRLWHGSMLSIACASILAALAPVAGLAPDALACSCVPRDPASCDARWDAPENEAIVFEATVSSIEFARGLERGPTQLVHLRDLRPWFKRAELEVRTGIGLGNDCGYDFAVGARYLIEAYRDDDGGISTDICSLTQPLGPTSDAVERLRALSAASPGADVIVSLRASQALPARMQLTLEGPVRRMAMGGGSRFFFRGLPAGAYQLRIDPALGVELASEPFRSIQLATDRSCVEIELDVVSAVRSRLAR
jgi:hypothetical protein